MPFPQQNQMGAPPMAPPELPTMSGMPPEGMPPGAPPDPSGGDSPSAPPGQAGALPQLFFGIDQQLKTLAKVLPPELVADLDAISQAIRSVFIKAVQRGSAARPTQMGMEGIAPQPGLSPAPSPVGGLTP